MTSHLSLSDAVALVLREAKPGDHLQEVEARTAQGRVLARAVVSLEGGAGAGASDDRSFMLEEGTLLTPPRVAALAAAGVRRVEVFQPPFFFTVIVGDHPAGAAPDARSRLDAAILDELSSSCRAGCECLCLGTAIVPAGPDALRGVLREQAMHDVLVAAGADRDDVVAVLRDFGEVVFDRVAARPLERVVFARLRQRTPRPQLFLGLPGEPVACLLAAQAFWMPMLRKMSRLPPREPRTQTARWSGLARKAGDAHELAPVRLAAGRAEPTDRLVEIDGWVEIPPGAGPLGEGREVEVRVF
jgi:molybdopterin molybdotransferase